VLRYSLFKFSSRAKSVLLQSVLHALQMTWKYRHN